MYSRNGKGRMNGGVEGGGSGGEVEAGEWWTVGLSHQGCLLTCATKRGIHHGGRRRCFTQLHRHSGGAATCWARTHKGHGDPHQGAYQAPAANSITPWGGGGGGCFAVPWVQECASFHHSLHQSKHFMIGLFVVVVVFKGTLILLLLTWKTWWHFEWRPRGSVVWWSFCWYRHGDLLCSVKGHSFKTV